MINKIFSKQIENTNRQVEIDLLRGFTILIVIICHVGLYLGNPDCKGLYTFCDIIGSEFAAPIFMALMGISYSFSRHKNPIDLLKRGIKLFLIGYALSLYRSILPLLIFGHIDEWTSIEAFYVVDIMQLAGLAFMFLALLKKLKLKNIYILLISLVMVFIDQFIMLPENVTIENELLIGIINLFCPITKWSCFPFLTWFFFIAFGLCFGELLTHCINKKRLYTVLLILGLIGVVFVYGTFYYMYPNYTNYYFGNNFYYMGVINVLLTCFFVFFALAFWYFIANIIPNNIKKYLTYLSKNINIFYIFTWIIISMLIHIEAIYEFTLNTIQAIIMMILVTVACTLLTILWNKIINKLKIKTNK